MSDSQRLPWSRRCRSIGSTSRLESACSGAAGGFCERHVLPIGIARGVIASQWPPGTEQGDAHSLEQVSGVWCACSLVLLSAHPCTPAFPHACVDVASHVRYRVRLVMIRPGFAPGARRAFRVDFPCVKPFRIKQVAALHPVCVPCFACLSRVRQHQRGLRTRSAVQKSTAAFRIGSELELH